MLRPLLVENAIKLADSHGFKNSCLDEVGELLHLLAGHIRDGSIAEIGTGFGVGTAWMASATTIDVCTVDNDEDKALLIKDLFAQCPNVNSIVGDWTDVLDEGPFQLVFVDASPAKVARIDQIIDATEIGGLIVIDDLTPVEFWPEEWTGQPDPIRDAWLLNRRLTSVEVRTSSKASVILSRRLA